MRLPLFSVIGLSLVMAACMPQASQETSVPHNKASDNVASVYAAPALLELSLPELSVKLAAGETTSLDLTDAYLQRIKALQTDGPQLRAFIELNPAARAFARESDKRRAAGQSLGPLDGIPIALKDNIETLDPMPTTAGAAVLARNVTERDSPLVAGLRSHGAVVLGKTNLSEWANFKSENSSSGYSEIAGQVRNPHVLGRNPCGSSSGSGVAVAASLAAGAVGTETNGSIICPAQVNGVVGFKPTVGLVPQDYIVPISASQDTAGPMTKTVRGAAMMLGPMAGEGADYAATLDVDSLSGTRVGVMAFSLNSDLDLTAKFNAAKDVLAGQGAVLVPIEAFDIATDDFWDKALLVLEYEFKDGVDRYLADAPKPVLTRSLADVIAYNKGAFSEPAYDQDLLIRSDARGALTSADYLAALADIQKAARGDGIDSLLKTYDVDVLIGPSGPIAPLHIPGEADEWGYWAGAGYLAAVAGYPNLTVPMGLVGKIPVGLSFMGAKDSDAKILSYGYAYEQASRARTAPQYLKDDSN